MIKKTMIGILSAALCLLLLMPAAMAETRQSVIFLEGMEEPIEETLFESPLGFSFWYANDRVEAYHGEADNIAGVIVAALYSDDYMVLSMIPEEDAVEYTEDLGVDIAEQSAASRVLMDVYREAEGGTVFFLTLIAENGQYFRAVGEYSMEASEGNARFFDRVLDSVAFTTGCAISAEWGAQSMDEEGRAQVILTAAEPVTDASLLRLDWDGITVSWEQDIPLDSFAAQQSKAVMLCFIGDMPGNGIQYTDEAGVTHAFALDISGEDGELYFWRLEE